MLNLYKVNSYVYLVLLVRYTLNVFQIMIVIIFFQHFENGKYKTITEKNYTNYYVNYLYQNKMNVLIKKNIITLFYKTFVHY